jgi:hypothetical protein
MTRQSSQTTAAWSRPRTPAPASGAAFSAFLDLEQWLDSRKTAVRGLHDVEVEAEHRGRELLRLLFQSHIDSRGSGDVGPAIVVRSGHDSAPSTLYTHRRAQPRRLITVFGQVSISRIGYGIPGQASIHPLDQELHLPRRIYSYEIQRRLVKAAVLMPFDEALEMLADGTGVVVPKGSAEAVLIDVSADFDAFYAGRGARAADGHCPMVVGSIDGKGIPMVKPEPAGKKVRLGRGEKRQKKRVATVAAVFAQMAVVRTPEEVIASLFSEPEDGLAAAARHHHRRPVGKRVWASLLSGKDAFIADVRAEMSRRDPQRRKVWVVVTDGERAIQRRVCRTLADVIFVLDLLHVMEKLWKAAYELHPEGSPDAEAFVRLRLLRILRGEVSQVIKGLRQIVTKRRLTGNKGKTLLAVASYYAYNRPRMRYDDYLAQGLPIASGSVEGACKNLVKDRMERSGMRWSPEMAEAMLRMRATYLSDDFEEYWRYHVTQEQRRLYPKDRWYVPRETVVLK